MDTPRPPILDADTIRASQGPDAADSTPTCSQIEEWLADVDVPERGDAVASQPEPPLEPRAEGIEVVSHGMDLLGTQASREAREALESRGEVIDWHGPRCIYPRAVVGMRESGRPVWLVWRNGDTPAAFVGHRFQIRGADPVLCGPTKANPCQTLPVLIVSSTTAITTMPHTLPCDLAGDPLQGLKPPSDGHSVATDAPLEPGLATECAQPALRQSGAGSRKTGRGTEGVHTAAAAAAAPPAKRRRRRGRAKGGVARA